MCSEGVSPLGVSVGLLFFWCSTLNALNSLSLLSYCSATPHVRDLTLVTLLHVYLQAVCSPLSFSKANNLKKEKRETCLVCNVNFLNINQHGRVLFFPFNPRRDALSCLTLNSAPTE